MGEVTFRRASMDNRFWDRFGRTLAGQFAAVAVWVGVVALLMACGWHRGSLSELIAVGGASVLMVLAGQAHLKSAWTIAPELKHRISDEELERIIDDVSPRRTRPLLVVLAFLISLVATIAAFRVLGAILPSWRSTDIGQYLQAGLWFLPWIGWPVVWVFLVRRRLIPAVRRRANQTAGLKLCVHCGYDLQGSPEPRCPECGRATESS